MFYFGSVQLLSHVQLFMTPWTAACQASLSITNSWSLLKLMSIKSVMPSNYMILCCPLLLPPSVFPKNIWDWFHLRCTGWISLLSKGFSNSLLQEQSSKASILLCSAFFRRRQWYPTPVLLPGKSHGQRSLVGCGRWHCQESDMTERLHFHFSLSCIEERNGNPLQCSCLENLRDGGAWWASIYGVSQSQTRLKWLSSSSSSSSFLHNPTFTSIHDYWKNHSLD